MWPSAALVEKIIKLRLTKEKWSVLVDKSSDLICSDISGWYIRQHWWPLSWSQLTKVVRLTNMVVMNWQNWWAVAKVGELTKVGATHMPVGPGRCAPKHNFFYDDVSSWPLFSGGKSHAMLIVTPRNTAKTRNNEWNKLCAVWWLLLLFLHGAGYPLEDM